MGLCLLGCQTMHLNVLIVILLTMCTHLSSCMPNNNGSQQKDKKTDSMKLHMTTMPPKSISNGTTMLTTEVPPVDTGIVEGNTDETRRVLYNRQMNNDSKFRLSTPSDTNDQSTKEIQMTSESYSEKETNGTFNETQNSDHSSTLPTVNQSNPWTPYSLSTDYTTSAMHAQPRVGVPPVSLINEPIQEGDATPSRGRSGSPRQIDTFPPLQNQPGQEYIDALIRRTLSPSKSTTPMPPPKDKSSPGLQKSAQVASSPPNIDKSTKAPKVITTTGFSNRRVDEDSNTSQISEIANTFITSTDNHPSIGTAFSLNEDFTDAHLTMKFEHDASILTEPPVTKSNLPIHRKEVTSSSNKAQKVLLETNATTESHKAVQTTINSTFTTASIKSLPNQTTSLGLEGTNFLVTTISTKESNIKNNTDISINAKTEATTLPVTISSLASTTSIETTVPTTTRQLTTSRIRGLPTLRIRSPSPSVKKKLLQTSTTTGRTVPTTTVSDELIDPFEHTNFDDMDTEFDEGLPPTWPPEPSSTRRQWLVTTPPLLDEHMDGHQGNREMVKDNTVNMHMESTQVISPTDKSNEGIIPAGAKNAIIISGIIGGCAILFFAVLMIFCMWRQYMSRRPIYPPPESSNSSSSSGFSGKLG